MKRRQFIGLVGGAAAWPLVARTQQASIPIIGFLSAGSPQSDAVRLAAFRQGLNETGYVEGRNVTLEYRGMQGHYDLLPALIADFVHRPVAVIVASGTTAGALAAKAATTMIPILFLIGADPIDAGLVVSLNRPGGNITGITNLQASLALKRLELLRELIPGIAIVAVLVNPSNSPYTEYETNELRNAARSLGLQLHLLNATTTGEIDASFATLAQVRAGAVLITADAFFVSRPEQLIALAARYAVPAIYPQREFTTAGGLISYGMNPTDGYHRIGVYTGRILKGEKPADLPVEQATKVELIINMKAAKAIGIEFPLILRVRADAVIE
jgi:ABC-type uncharacterized transport system substrate-binding protein